MIVNGVLMIEIYFLIAMISNVIADILIWKEVKIMRISHQTIQVDTKAMKVSIETSQAGFEEFSSSLGPALSDHAKLTAKALGSAIGYYQGKAEKATSGEIEGLQDTLQALGPLAQLIGTTQKTGGNSGSGKFHV